MSNHKFNRICALQKVIAHNLTLRHNGVALVYDTGTEDFYLEVRGDWATVEKRKEIADKILTKYNSDGIRVDIVYDADNVRAFTKNISR